jgi:predicted MPP superfamily phosphohydrolase
MRVAELVLILVWVNLLPFLADLVMGDRLAWPVDGGRVARDGRALLGSHKTLRGVLISVLGAGAAGPLLGLSVWTGAAAGALAMSGDLITSYLKRRLGHASGKPVLGLDQALEGALPLTVLVPAMGLAAAESALALIVFVPLSHAGSRLAYYLLYRPPPENYPRVIRATTRLREWRACHVPMARWQKWFNFENYVYYRVVMILFFRAIGWYERGVRNALAVQVQEHSLHFENLPPAFDGFRVLFLTDLHLDGLEPLTDVLIERVRDVEADLCLIGGDIRMEVYGPMAPSVRLLKRLVSHVRTRHGVYGVLGNHDCIEMLPEFEEAGVTMLVNDSQELKQDGQSLWLVGVDDPHFYKCHDLERAFRGTPQGGFKLFLAHSPEAYREAAAYGAHMYLCGHTHGGQICLPGIGPLFTHSSAPRFTAAGQWSYRGMVGYTCRGAGASGVPLRFNCPGEIPLIILRREPAADPGPPGP